MKNIRQMTVTALMAALICVLAPISIPLISEVPISMATFAIMLAGIVLGARLGTAATAVYLTIGALGIPVYAGYSAGVAKLFGVTGGYLFGFLFLAYISGAIYERFGKNESGTKKLSTMILGMILGNAVLYIFGTVWFIYVTKMSLAGALAACVIPFIPGDLLKIVMVALLAPRLEPAVRMNLKSIPAEN